MLRSGLDVGLAARVGWAGGVAGLGVDLGRPAGQASMVVLGQPLWVCEFVPLGGGAGAARGTFRVVPFRLGGVS